MQACSSTMGEEAGMEGRSEDVQVQLMISATQYRFGCHSHHSKGIYLIPGGGTP